MLNIGLTGNIGAGKSTVARWLRDWGATLIDSDELVRDVQRPGSSTLRSIAGRFGADVLRADGSLDRDVLRDRAMGDAASLEALNEIVHPAVQRLRAERAHQAAEQGDCVLVNDIPLLFEVLDPGAFDLIVLVDAPETVRRERIERERGLPRDVAERMIAAQLPAATKRAQSDIVLDNDGSLEQLEATARAAWRTIRSRAAAQLTDRHGVLLAVATDRLEAVRAFGGTMARYVDAGVETWLALTAPAVPDAGVDLIGLRGILPLGTAGQTEGDETAVAAAVERTIRERRPHVTVALGPHGGTRAPLAEVVHDAWRAAGSPGMLFWTADAHGDASIHARLDVRPWRDVWRAALDALGTTPDPAADALPERDTFTASAPPAQTLVDLFHALDRTS